MQLFRVTKKLKGNETGVTLIETLVALAILGLIAVAFLSGLATASKATIIADERATAESLARSQMEYVKSQGYITNPGPGAYGLIAIPANYPATYSVGSTAVPIDPETGLPSGDNGIQLITVTVNHNENLVLTVEGYKVDR